MDNSYIYPTTSANFTINPVTYQSYWNLINQTPDPQKEKDELVRKLMKDFADRPNKMFYNMGKRRVFRYDAKTNCYELSGGAGALRVSKEVLTHQNIHGRVVPGSKATRHKWAKRP